MSDLPAWLKGVPPEGPELCFAHPFGEPHLRSLQLLYVPWGERRGRDAIGTCAYCVTLDAAALRTLRAMITRELAEIGEDDD